MNFLAHSVLSPKSDLILIGNFAGDFFKGSKLDVYHDDLQEGVKLHRMLDVYTDQHEKVRESKAIVRESFGLFSGIAIDMFWDYFLAKNWTIRDKAGFDKHVQNVYQVTQDNLHHCSDLVKQVFPIMYENDWLRKYGTYDGLSLIMHQMHKRIGKHSKLNNSVDVLIKNEAPLEALFLEFWEDVVKYCGTHYTIINPLI